MLFNTSSILLSQNKDNTSLVLFYSIKADSSISTKKILRFESTNILDSRTDQKIMFYDYCDNLVDCDKKYEKKENGLIHYSHYENTGLRKSDNSYYIHPPRSDNFKILELNAFPFYRGDVDTWQYKVTFGDNFSSIKWKTWNGFKTSVSNYTVDGSINFKYNDDIINCIKITANTKIDGLGETNSVFYYNKIYGFVYMNFKTIDNKEIEFKLMKDRTKKY